MTKRPIIYSLHDPETEELRYIGYSRTTPGQRLGHHIGHAVEGSSTLCAEWIRSIIATGRLPIIRVIKEDATFDDEVAEIAAQRQAGARLLNVANGGKGAPGVKKTPEQRQAMSLRAKEREKSKIYTPEMRAAMSARSKGVKKPPRTAEHRANIAAAHRGMKASEEARRNMSLAHIGKPGPPPLTPEQRKRRSAAVAMSWIARRQRSSQAGSEE